jgi:hypothetical protein
LPKAEVNGSAGRLLEAATNAAAIIRMMAQRDRSG